MRYIENFFTLETKTGMWALEGCGTSNLGRHAKQPDLVGPALSNWFCQKPPDIPSNLNYFVILCIDIFGQSQHLRAQKSLLRDFFMFFLSSKGRPIQMACEYSQL